MSTVSVARRTLLDPERLEGLVDSTYELLLDRDQWPQYMLKLAEALGGSQPMLFLHDLEIQTRDPVPISVGYDPSVLRAYREYLAARNVWVHGALPLLQPGRVRISHRTEACKRIQQGRKDLNPVREFWRLAALPGAHPCKRPRPGRMPGRRSRSG